MCRLYISKLNDFNPNILFTHFLKTLSKYKCETKNKIQSPVLKRDQKKPTHP